MKNIKGILAIFLICVLLGIILSMQFKTTQNITGGTNPATEAKALLAELNKLESEKAQVKKELSEIENKIKKLEEDEAKKNYYLQTLYDELEKYKIFLGYEDIEGPGIQIEINEPEMEAIFDDGSSIVAENYDTLMQIITALNAANAEAMSINDIRYTSYSTFEKENNSILFDDHVISAPIIIKAIGDPKELESNLTFRGGILDYMQRGLQLKINVSKKDKLVIPSLHKKTELKYIRPVDKLNN
ncbi:DUF881 domain-containing protein [Proteiniborus sp.]|uniref:DUF881 domain-containing protein n=1 Tax=Proteiniborus sp. TaxID=2079015 RepID=UPI00332DE498